MYIVQYGLNAADRQSFGSAQGCWHAVIVLVTATHMPVCGDNTTPIGNDREARLGVSLRITDHVKWGKVKKCQLQVFHVQHNK